jgi:6-phosphofructokinase 1
MFGGRKAILLSCGDSYTRLLSLNKDRLDPVYIPVCPDYEAVDSVNSKVRFYSFCEKAGIPYPETVIIRDAGIPELPFGYPLVLKPDDADDYNAHPFEGQKKALDTLEKHGIEGLIVIGGDGSFRGAKALSEQYGVPTIGIPGTIDNDLAYTDYTLGFDTAVNTCLDIINKLRDTMTSHERVSVVEVMGRHCGDIALYSGIASGAEIIVVPEIAFDMDEIVSKINRSRASGKHSNIIVVAEGVMGADQFAKQLQQRTTHSIRPTCIGHVQRGGSPSMADRMLAAQFGNKAVRLLLEGHGNRVVGIRDNKIIDMDIIEAVSMKKTFNYELYETLQMISM